MSSLEDIKGVGHRVVQGGSYFKESAIIDEDVVQKIDEINQRIESLKSSLEK